MNHGRFELGSTVGTEVLLANASVSVAKLHHGKVRCDFDGLTTEASFTIIDEDDVTRIWVHHNTFAERITIQFVIFDRHFNSSSLFHTYYFLFYLSLTIYLTTSPQ